MTVYVDNFSTPARVGGLWRERGFVQQKAHGKCQACYMRDYTRAKAPQPLDDATVVRLRAAVGLAVSGA